MHTFMVVATLVNLSSITEAQKNSRSTTHPDGTQTTQQVEGATVGWIRGGGIGNFSTETFYAWTDSPELRINKTLSSRNGFAYWNTSGGYRTSADWHVRDLTMVVVEQDL